MTILDSELRELKLCVEKQIPHSKLETCVKAMVRVNIQPVKYKQIVACFQFPDDYPASSVLLELRSRYVSQKLIDGLTKLCEEELKKYCGKPQVLRALKFICNFVEENPLVCCSEEISSVKKLLLRKDELKLRQKSSSILLQLTEGEYVLKYNIVIPENYHDVPVQIELKYCNYPPVFVRWLLAQSNEIARKCVIPSPKRSPEDPHFAVKPSLLPVIAFLVEECHKSPQLECPGCRKICFPKNPNDVETEETKPYFIERIYCGHIYHFGCLDSYIRAPPFQGGKKCISCGLRIYHNKWKLTPELAEARWAHKQAKQRELDEVVDFLS